MVLIIERCLIPATLRYLNKISAINQLEIINPNSCNVYFKILVALSDSINELSKYIENLKELLKKLQDLNDIDGAEFAVKEIRPLIEKIRHYSDLLEKMAPEDLWPYPTYVDILHSG